MAAHRTALSTSNTFSLIDRVLSLLEIYLSQQKNPSAAAKNFRILLLAAGSGIELATILENISCKLGMASLLIIATDKAQACEEQMNDIISHYGAQNCTSFRIMDVHTLDFPDRYFDLIACFQSPMMFKDHSKVFGEIARTLKPGEGKLIISTPFDSSVWTLLNDSYKKSIVRRRQSEWHLFKNRLGVWNEKDWPNKLFPSSLVVNSCEMTKTIINLSEENSYVFLKSLWTSPMMSFMLEGLQHKEKELFKKCCSHVVRESFQTERNETLRLLHWDISLIVIATRTLISTKE